MSGRDEHSRDVGIKLARALHYHAARHAREENLDVSEVLRGAADYLREHADDQNLVDESRTTPEERQN